MRCVEASMRRLSVSREFLVKLVALWFVLAGVVTIQPEVASAQSLRASDGELVALLQDKKDKEKQTKEEKEAEKEAEKAAKELEKQQKKEAKELEKLLPKGTPGPLDSIPVPLPPDIDSFVKDQDAAVLLGKALFWDMQVGSDGKTACASCHFHAGVDNRTRNTLAPGAGTLERVNYDLQASDFPFHRLKNPNEKRSDKNPVIFDTPNIVGSQGVIKKDFVSIVETGTAIDIGELVQDAIFNINGTNTRQVTGRNTPSTVNAVFNDRNFWDGRANRFFNGVNPFGDMDPNARVWKSSNSGLAQVRILLDNASLASQAVGPPLSEVEMSWNGRTFPEIGRKLLGRRPLALQEVHPNDSVLGPYANPSGPGLVDVTYAELIQLAFQNEWWDGTDTINGELTHMEANFSLYWGLAIMMYERTLVSDETPFDQFAKGNVDALTAQEREGLEIFLNQGKCINCHSGPEFTGAAISQLRGVLNDGKEALIELMKMEEGKKAFYDAGFYNIGVRPTEEDLGVGASHPEFGPLSLSRRVQEGQDVDLNGVDIRIRDKDRVAVDGAFKTPGLRNIELTGPYMHNGGMRTLREVVLFYARRADFFEENIDDLDPDVDGIGHIRGDDERIDAVVAFMKALTDERVRYQKAPFDHPELRIPNGHSGVVDGVAVDNTIVLPAVGAEGGDPIPAFDEVVN